MFLAREGEATTRVRAGRLEHDENGLRRRSVPRRGRLLEDRACVLALLRHLRDQGDAILPACLDKGDGQESWPRVSFLPLGSRVWGCWWPRRPRPASRSIPARATTWSTAGTRRWARSSTSRCGAKTTRRSSPPS